MARHQPKLADMLIPVGDAAGPLQCQVIFITDLLVK